MECSTKFILQVVDGPGGQPPACKAKQKHKNSTKIVVVCYSSSFIAACFWATLLWNVPDFRPRIHGLQSHSVSKSVGLRQAWKRNGR